MNLDVLIATIVSSVVAALVATALTWWRESYNRRAQAQDWINHQWWQRKADAYTQIVETLWQRLEYAREYEESLYADREEGPDARSEKYQDMEGNRANLRRAADVGAFVISEEAAQIFSQLFQAGCRGDGYDRSSRSD